MDKVKKEDLRLRFEAFQQFALEDQGRFYRRERARSLNAERGINRIRATIALITGIAAAIAAALGQTYFVEGASCQATQVVTAQAIVAESPEGIEILPEGPVTEFPPALTNPVSDALSLLSDCDTARNAITIMIILSITLPAIGGFFSSLSDLYQWERLTAVYANANQNLIYADALSPDPEEPYEEYFTSYHAYVEGALQVMSDETKQWGQAIRKPEKTDEFIERMRDRARKVTGQFSNDEAVPVIKPGDSNLLATISDEDINNGQDTPPPDPPESVG